MWIEDGRFFAHPLHQRLCISLLPQSTNDGLTHREVHGDQVGFAEFTDVKGKITGLPCKHAPDDRLHLLADGLVDLSRRKEPSLDQHLAVELTAAVSLVHSVGELLSGELATAVEQGTQAVGAVARCSVKNVAFMNEEFLLQAVARNFDHARQLVADNGGQHVGDRSLLEVALEMKFLGHRYATRRRREYTIDGTMLSPEEAWKLIDERLRPLPVHEVARMAALRHVLAAPLTAQVDMPPADVSAMDGYVYVGEAEAGAHLPVLGTIAAGAPADWTLKAGQASKIMTGAVVPAVDPDGAERVIPVEQTDAGSETVEIRTAMAAGAHIRRRGEVTRTGDPLLNPGTPLTPTVISLLASHGYSKIPVYRRPTVAVLTTGDELVPPEEDPGPGQLRDSNSAFLVAAGEVLGFEMKHLGIASDRREELSAKIAEGLQADVLLLSGGVSMGEFDLVEDVLAEHGCRQIFDKVAIQPGKPLVAAVHDREERENWVFGLPGNPASVMATFRLFVVPVLRRLMGYEDSFWHGALRARLQSDLPAGKNRDRFLAAGLAFQDGEVLATPSLPRGSHDVASYAHGTAFVRMRPECAPAKAGDSCEVLPWAILL